MREVVIKLSHDDIDALRCFVYYHTKETNIILREWLEDGGAYRQEKIKYTFEELPEKS